MKDTQSEIKQNIEGSNSDKKGTRTQSNDLEQKKKIQLEQNEDTRTQKNEESLRNFWDNLKCSNI